MRSPLAPSGYAVSATEMEQVHHCALDCRDVGFDADLGNTAEVTVSMSLSSFGNPAWESIRGVRFSMLHGPALVAVLVTHAALDDFDDIEHGSQENGYLALFNKHRCALEQAASAKHQRGEVGESGVVIVQAGDLKMARS